MSKPTDPEYHRKYYLRNRELLMRRARESYDSKKDTAEFKAKKKAERETAHYGHSSEEVFAKTGGVCSRCGKPAELVHHMDRDGRNLERAGIEPGKDIERLEPYCRSCHIEEHRAELTAARNRRYASRWSLKFDECAMCHATEHRHYGHGYCVKCFPRWKRGAKTRRKKREPGV